VDRQITLGQFVATEIVIVTIVSAIEKIIASLETVYDTLTSVEKMGNVTDLALERRTGFHLMNTDAKGIAIQVKNLKFTYPNTIKQVLNGISFQLNPGEKLCISGSADSGKNTIVRLLLGLYNNYEGVIEIDGMSLRDLSLPYFRTRIGENIMNNVAYDGTLMNNITMGQAEATPQKVVEIVHELNMSDILYQHPEGLMANALSGEVQLSESSLYKLTMARSLVGKPSLVIFDDHIMTLSEADRSHLLNYIMNGKNNWSVLIISNDEIIASMCNRRITIDNGIIVS
jgi:ABC-type multidrug transport system fused ATPase/permease subunit